MSEIKPEVLQTTVRGTNLEPRNLVDQLKEDEQLLVFLRHLG